MHAGLQRQGGRILISNGAFLQQQQDEISPDALELETQRGVWWNVPSLAALGTCGRRRRRRRRSGGQSIQNRGRHGNTDATGQLAHRHAVSTSQACTVAVGSGHGNLGLGANRKAGESLVHSPHDLGTEGTCQCQPLHRRRGQAPEGQTEAQAAHIQKAGSIVLASTNLAQSDLLNHKRLAPVVR